MDAINVGAQGCCELKLNFRTLWEFTGNRFAFNIITT